MPTPLGAPNSEASPDNDTVPKCTPGPMGFNDAAGCILSKNTPKIPPLARTYTEKQFKNFFIQLYSEDLGNLVDWNQEIVVLFTRGKQNGLWDDVDSTASGYMSGVLVDGKQKYLGGSMVVDILQIARGITIRSKAHSINIGFMPMLAPSGEIKFTRTKSKYQRNHSQELKRLRISIFKIMAHEYFHIIQKWRKSLVGMEDNYTEVYYQLLEKEKKLHPDENVDNLRAAVHAHHPQEQEAEKLARIRIQKMLPQINNGVFDHCIPINDLYWYLNH